MDFIKVLNSVHATFDVLMIVSIIVVYAIHIHYRWQIYKLAKKTTYSWLLLYFIGVSILFIGVFAYLLSNILLGRPIILTSYGVLLIRPIIFLTGCVLVSSARATLLTMKLGGCLWKLQKPKI